MKRIFTLLMMVSLVSFLLAQDGKESKADKKEKTEKTKKDKKKGSKRDDAHVFIGEPDKNYTVEQRREVNKPQMPMYDVSQGFNSQKKKKKQQDAFIAKKYFYPSKPKNAWQIGILGGISNMNGDINPNFFKGAKPFVPGYNFGANVKKAFGYTFALRLSYDFNEFWNSDWQPSTLTTDQIANTRVTTSNPTAFAGYAAGQKIFQNTHTVSHELTLDPMLSFGNKRFHKERTNVVFNLFASAGGMLFKTWYDLYDNDGNPYDYDALLDPNYDKTDKKQAIKDLMQIRNRVYETAAEQPTKASSPKLMGYNLIPVFGGGMGFTFRLNRVLDLDLSTKMMFTRTDLLDGMQWQEPERNGSAYDSRGQTREFDTYLVSQLGLNFKLVGKKKTEPTTLLNPMAYTYSKMAADDPKAMMDDLLKDTDADGVPDKLDEEPDTPEGAPVSVKGIAIDSDSDGYKDYEDDEPFSPPGVPVNDKGVAQLPPPPVIETGGACCDCDNAVLPSIHFDKDKYYISPEYYAHLYTIADKMQSCPDMKIKAIGMADKDDNSKYNEQLSWERANAVREYLHETYGIERNRIMLDYTGESTSSGTSRIEKYLDRQVAIEPVTGGGGSDSAEPHPGIKAGSDK